MRCRQKTLKWPILRLSFEVDKTKQNRRHCFQSLFKSLFPPSKSTLRPLKRPLKRPRPRLSFEVDKTKQNRRHCFQSLFRSLFPPSKSTLRPLGGKLYTLFFLPFHSLRFIQSEKCKLVHDRWDQR